MEARTINVAGVTLAVGLDWVDVSATEKGLRKEIQRMATERGARRHIVFGEDGERLVGFPVLALEEHLPSKGALSLAALFAGYPGIAADALLITETGENRAIIVGLRNGMPAQGFEGEGSLEEVRALAKRFTGMVPSGITIYGTAEDMGVVPLTLELLVENSVTKGAAKLVPVAGSGAALLLLLLIVAGGAGGFYWYQGEQSAERARLVAQQTPTEDPNKLYMAQLEPLLAVRERIAPSLANAVGLLNATRFMSGGWVLEQATCSGGACLFKWKRDFGTNASFPIPENAASVQRTPDGASLTYMQPYETVAGLTVDELGSMDSLILETMSRYQPLAELGVAFTISPSALMGAPTVPAETLAVSVHEGSYIMEGPWWASSALKYLPASSSLDQLELIGGEVPQFKIQGRYHVK